MTTSTVSLPNGNQPTTSAQWQTWGTNLAAGFTAVGLVQTTDTGQVSWTTVGGGTAPAANVLIGYEIYRFNDTLQSTAPVFLRVEYRTSSTTAAGYLIITVGRGTNGAGTLTTGSGNYTGKAAFSADTAARSCLFVGDGSSLGIAQMWGTTNASATGLQTFFLARTQDSTGTYNGDGLWGFGHDNSTTNTRSGTFNYTANAWQETTAQGGFAALWVGASTGSFGTDLYVAPLLISCAGKVEGQPTLAYGFYVSDFTLGATTTINSKTYIALRDRWGGWFSLTSSGTGSTNHCALMLWQ